MLKRFCDYRCSAEMQKVFDGADRSCPITCRKYRALVCTVAAGSGEKLNRAACVKETKREEGACKRAAEANKTQSRTHTRSRGSGVEVIGSTALTIRALHKECVRGCLVLHGIDPEPDGTGLKAIIGPSGTGRNTSIRGIGRLVEPSAAAIPLDGTDLARLSATALRNARRRIGMVLQAYRPVERLSVMENLLCGRLGYVPRSRRGCVATRRRISTAPSNRSTPVASAVRPPSAPTACRHRAAAAGR